MPNVNVFVSKDIRYIAARVIKLDTKAKANKTLAGRLGTILTHVESLAKQGRTPRDRMVRSIASQELVHQHQLFLSVKGQNLPTNVAEQMKSGVLGAMQKILTLFK